MKSQSAAAQVPEAPMTQESPPVKLTRKDFDPGIDVRWCPGCGDYAILATVQRTLPELGVPKENYAFISGIGCSSRFPYYMDTYGFHTIHGRAPAVATGLKSTRPELSVWVVTGDGDALSIGGNHLIHALRRNPDINILMFNNRIYGLTKGQYSPTSEVGKRTKSTPVGSIDQPFNPISMALGAEGSFVARSVDRDAKHLGEMVKAAARHKGASFLEIYQNCNIFNDGAFSVLTERDTKSDNVLYLEHGKPLLFGKDRNKGIALDENGRPKVVVVGEDGVTEADVMVHDERHPDPSYAFMLSRLEPPHFPAPVGIFRRVERPTYEAMLNDQIDAAQQKKGDGDLRALLHAGDTWTVK
jgi:2-oxoglutarate/2-oxoacid ferredoxin oxidoreductase subunit beta